MGSKFELSTNLTNTTTISLVVNLGPDVAVRSGGEYLGSARLASWLSHGSKQGRKEVVCLSSVPSHVLVTFRQ